MKVAGSKANIKQVPLPTPRKDLERFLSDQGCTRIKYNRRNLFRAALTKYGFSHVFADEVAKGLLRLDEIQNKFSEKQAQGLSFEQVLAETFSEIPELMAVKLGDDTLCFMANPANLRKSSSLTRSTDLWEVFAAETARPGAPEIQHTLDIHDGGNVHSTGDQEKVLAALFPFFPGHVGVDRALKL